MTVSARIVVRGGRLMGASRAGVSYIQISAGGRRPGCFPSPGTLTASPAAAEAWCCQKVPQERDRLAGPRPERTRRAYLLYHP